MDKNLEIASRNTNTLFENQIWKVPQVAEYLGFSKDHVYRLVNQKKIPFRKRGKTLFFMGQEIFDWVNQGVQ